MMRRYPLLMLCTAAITLSACSEFHMPGKASAPRSGTAVSASAAKSSSDKVASALASAARDAQGSGMNRESLMFDEKLYRGNPNNPDYILQYARGLRRAGRTNDAQLVIRTPAKSPKATEPLLTECAMVLVSSGMYDEALGFAQQAVEKNEKSPDSHHALALALSGLGKNVDAEMQFKRALRLWPDGRDQTPVINNLAMSQLAQGKVNEAKATMALATGEALASATYQNNRALLGTLEDKNIPQPEMPEGIQNAPPGSAVILKDKIETSSVAPRVTVTSKAPANRNTPVRMTPIVDQ